MTKQKRYELKTVWDEDGAPRGTHVVPALSIAGAVGKVDGPGWRVTQVKELREISLAEVQRRLPKGTLADFTYLGDIRATITPTTRRTVSAQTPQRMVSRPVMRCDEDGSGEGIRCDWLRQKAREEFGCIIISDEDGTDYLKIRILKV